jgi:hypothetical protein
MARAAAGRAEPVAAACLARLDRSFREIHRTRSRDSSTPSCGLAAGAIMFVESFVVRTAVNSRAAERLVGLGVLLLLLVEVGVGANRSSYTRAVAGSNPAAPIHSSCSRRSSDGSAQSSECRCWDAGVGSAS